MIAPLTTTTEDSPTDLVDCLRNDESRAAQKRRTRRAEVTERRATFGAESPVAPTGVAALAVDDSTWWAHARCNDGGGKLSRLFFSDDLHDIARAKHICATCPAMIPCLEGALARREPWGVWGGQLFRNGKILASKRRRGRPPKRPRPEDQLPDIPIPEHLQSVAVVRIA